MQVLFIVTIVSGLVALTTASPFDKETLVKAILQDLLEDDVDMAKEERFKTDLAIDCGDPPAVEHAFYMEPPNTMRGAVVRYMCEEGYILSESSAVIQCEKNRAWTSVRFTCNAVPQQSIDCGQPPLEIEFGEYDGAFSDNTTTLGSIKYFSCIDGYEVTSIDEDGMNTDIETEIICQEDGMWSTPGSCEAVNCGKLSNPANGRVSVSMTTVGGVATYRCNSRQVLYGSRTRTCQADKMWSGKTPKCKQCKKFWNLCERSKECCGGMRCSALGLKKRCC